jgi:hypothetical protein
VQDQKCPACGSEFLDQGKIVGYPTPPYFSSRSGGFFSVFRAVPLHAHLCLDCGAISLNGDPKSVKKLADKRRAEGR